MMKPAVLATTLLLAFAACGSKEDTRSKPVSCPVAAQMVTKRLGEFADGANVTGERRVTLDKGMTAAISARCTEDKWDEVVLGCLGAMATIREGEIDVATYRKGIDVCTKAIGEENQKKLDDAVGAVIRSIAKN